jgi:hypothetical protein
LKTSLLRLGPEIGFGGMVRPSIEEEEERMIDDDG